MPVASLRDGEFELMFASAAMRDWEAAFRSRRVLTIVLAMLLLVGGPLAILAVALRLEPFIVAPQVDWWVGPGVVLLLYAFLLVVVLALVLVLRRRSNLKRPVLTAVAEARGLTYRAKDFESPISTDAADMLTGHWTKRRHFQEDCFHGHDGGLGYTFFDMTTTVGTGKHAQDLFRGTVHACDRAGGPAQILIWPPPRTFNWPRGDGGIPAVTIGDAEFDAAFRVRATDPDEAVRLLRQTPLARFLLEQRPRGPVHAYVGPNLAILGIGWKDRFEVGAMLNPMGARKRARRMHGQVSESVELLRRFRQLVG